MKNHLDSDVVEVLITQEWIRNRVAEMGKELSAAYSGSLPLLVGVLKGCAMFMADLIRHMDIPLETDYMAISSYAGDVRRGAVRITKDLDSIIEGRDVLIIEGLIDTGMTLGYLIRNLEARHPRSMKLCTFVDKPARRIVNVPIAFKGVEVPDRFVVGYGLDFHQLYRNLPYIGVLSHEITGVGKRQGK